MKRLVPLLCLLAGLTLAAPAHADRPADPFDRPPDIPAHPLTDMLALVPLDGNTPIITYGDYRAAEAARVRQLVPQTYTEYRALNSFDLSFWLWTYSRIAYLHFDMSSHLARTAPTMGETVGYEFFDIDRVMTYGLFPNSGVLLAGDFDRMAIDTAHERLGYIPATINGVASWCSPNGCESGGQIDTNNIFNGTLFGGNLGRYQTFLTMPGFLASSTRFEQIEAVADTSTGAQASVLARPDFQVAVRALLDPAHYNGQLVQVQFFPEESVRTVVDLTPFPDFETYINALRTREIPRYMRPREQWRDYRYGLLMPYVLALLADRQEGDDQVAIAGLVYTDTAQAQAAAQEFSARMATFSNEDLSRSPRPFLEFMADVVISPPRVYTDATSGYAVLLLEVRYPRVQEEVVFFRVRDAQPMQPAVVYQFWLHGMNANGFYPIWDIRLPEWFYSAEW
ncbi:MAG: hypothetical protein ACOCXZ_00200 [Chloroflexota bacterium]